MYALSFRFRSDDCTIFLLKRGEGQEERTESQNSSDEEPQELVTSEAAEQNNILVAYFSQTGNTDYMFLQVQFVFFDYGEPAVLFFADYLSVMCLFAVIGHYVSACMNCLNASGNRKRMNSAVRYSLAAGLAVSVIMFAVVEAEEDMAALMRYAHEVGYTFFRHCPSIWKSKREVSGQSSCAFP